MVTGSFILCILDKEGLSGWSKDMTHLDIWGKSNLNGRRNSKCKGPEVDYSIGEYCSYFNNLPCSLDILAWGSQPLELSWVCPLQVHCYPFLFHSSPNLFCSNILSYTVNLAPKSSSTMKVQEANNLLVWYVLENSEIFCFTIILGIYCYITNCHKCSS